MSFPLIPEPSSPAVLRSDPRALRSIALVLSLVSVALTGRVVVASAQAVAGDAAKGKVTYTKLCAACHGPAAKGQQALKAPALAGQADWYMVAQLTKFRAGIRGADPRDVTGAQMKAMAATLPNDQAVTDVVTYIASLK